VLSVLPEEKTNQPVPSMIDLGLSNFTSMTGQQADTWKCFSGCQVSAKNSVLYTMYECTGCPSKIKTKSKGFKDLSLPNTITLTDVQQAGAQSFAVLLLGDRFLIQHRLDV
jgi:hypothetical protein